MSSGQSALKPSQNIDLGGAKFGGQNINFGGTSAPVNFGGQSYGLSGGGNQITATNTKTGSQVSSADSTGSGMNKLAMLGALQGFQQPQSQMNMIYTNQYPTTNEGSVISKVGNGASKSPYEDEGIKQFLAWQQANGY